MIEPITSFRYGLENPPKSIEIAEIKILELASNVNKINIDLIDIERKEINLRTGETWSKREYNVWRKLALRAQGKMITELQFLKYWVKKERIRYNSQEINIDFNDPKNLIHAASRTLTSIKKRGIELTEEEKQIHYLLKDYLQHK